MTGAAHPERPRWNLTELSLIGLGFLMPLGEDVRPAVLNNPQLKVLMAAAALYFCAVSAIGLREAVRPMRYPQAVVLRILLAYAFVLGLATATRALPIERVVLFAFFLTAVVGFWSVERLRPGAWLDITYTVSILHVMLAVTLNERTLIASGVDRLGGATSSVLLAFESAMVLLVTLMRLQGATGWQRWLRLGLVLLCGYALIGAFSRAAFLSLGTALLIVWIYRTRPGYRAGKLLLGVTALLVVWQFMLDRVVLLLGGDDPESVYGASGRFVIWERIWIHNDADWRGWGFSALYDSGGPDKGLWALNQGLPPESALLQAFLMAGFLGAAIWVSFAGWVAYCLWSARGRTGGWSLGLLAILAVDATFSSAASGISFSWWWYLAAVTLAGTTARRTLRIHDGRDAAPPRVRAGAS